MCCGETPCPDQSTVKVLYANDISPDDFMWSVSCTAADLATFLFFPQNWVKCLAELPDWKAPGKVPVLCNPFNITLTERVLSNDEGNILIEGISDTAIVRVVVTENSGFNAVKILTGAGSDKWNNHPKVTRLREAMEAAVEQEWMNEYWDLFQYILEQDKSQPDLIRDLENQTWFGHLRVFDAKWAEIPGFRSEWLTAFLVMRLVDHTGYIQTLNALGPILREGDSATEEDVVITGTPHIIFTYNSMDPSNEEACDAIFGGFNPLTPNEMIVTDGIVKSYRVPPPPPPPPVRSDREAYPLTSR